MTEESLTSESDEDSYKITLDSFEEWDSISNNLVLQFINYISGKPLPHVHANTLNQHNLQNEDDAHDGAARPEYCLQSN